MKIVVKKSTIIGCSTKMKHSVYSYKKNTNEGRNELFRESKHTVICSIIPELCDFNQKPAQLTPVSPTVGQVEWKPVFAMPCQPCYKYVKNMEIVYFFKTKHEQWFWNCLCYLILKGVSEIHVSLEVTLFDVTRVPYSKTFRLAKFRLFSKAFRGRPKLSIFPIGLL